ncbi:hypothetical protein NAL89_13125, partial [Burkholderia glumae]|nr:hypothetical protein [Burkholderia glumae]MCQ0037346.1 hypothetical protein [Burkholderia glumae]
MTESTQIQPKPTDVFVAPLNDLHPADIDANLKALDRWLVDVSGGVLTLDRVKPTDVFVAPLNDLHPADIDANLKALDRWLVDVSGGVLTLDRVETIARNAPVLA